MACFIIPAAEALVTTIAVKVFASKEKKLGTIQNHSTSEFETSDNLSFSKKLGWLSKLLWGGSALLLFEHIWHGEIVPFFPFLTAAYDSAETAVMLREMASVGGCMSLLLTAVWAVMLLVTYNIKKRSCNLTLSKDRGELA